MDVEEMAAQYISGRSLRYIGDLAGISPGTVRYHLKKSGVETRSNKENSRRFYLNHHFFDVIDSEVKAYWLGFIFADGHVSSSGGKRVVVSQSTKSAGHLSKFVRALESNYPVKIYSGTTPYGPVEYERVTISSDNLYDSLISLGCLERKSKILEPPPLLDESLERHFLRGFYDGDGSVRRRVGSKADYSLSLVATRGMIEWAHDRLGGSVRYDEKKDIWCLETSINNKSLEYLYGGATEYLQRKYDRIVHARFKLQGTPCHCPELCKAQ